MRSLPLTTQRRICELVDDWNASNQKTPVVALANSPTASLSQALEKTLPFARIAHWSYIAPPEGTSPTLPENETTPDVCILFASKQRIETLGLLARLRAKLKQGGLFLFCCENALGAKGFQSRIKDAFPTLEVHLAQFWRILDLSTPALDAAVPIAGWLEESSAQLIPGTQFHTIPGIYGWNKIDTGSQLLIDSLPGPLAGRGIDLGCGYGYLSHEALSRSQSITAMTLLDHDWRSLDCARRNLESFPVPKQFHWCDISQFKPARDHDWALVNPPFHSGKQTDITLGRAFIAAAAAALHASGSLYLVANAFLPYGDLLRSLFSKVEKVRTADGFTVYHAAHRA